MQNTEKLLRWISKSNDRYYIIKLNRDLLGDLILTKAWGALNSNQGRVVHIFCKNIETAETAIQSLIKIRIKKGYFLSENQQS